MTNIWQYIGYSLTTQEAFFGIIFPRWMTTLNNEKELHMTNGPLKRMSKFLVLLAFTMSISGATHARGLLSPDSVSTPLQKAHAAYTNRDFKTMASEMKNAIMSAPADRLVRENALSLLEKAYQAGGRDGIPVDWHLPEEITKMRVGIAHMLHESESYSLRVAGNVTQMNLIQQMKVTRYPDDVVLDKKAGIGEWEETPGRNGDEPVYELSGKRSRQPIPGGLYLLRIEMASGKAMDGWFLLEENMNSSANPEVTTPAIDEHFQTGNPTFRFSDFRSPEYKPFEVRSVWMGISKSEPPKYDWNIIWEMYQRSPTLQEVTIGLAPDGVGVKKLENGRYDFVLNYSERKRFGDLLMSRTSGIHRNFFVGQ